jgi:sugar phosphate permease
MSPCIHRPLPPYRNALHPSPIVAPVEEPSRIAEGSREQSVVQSSTSNGSQPKSSLRQHQFLVVALLFAGYAAYYFCRADFSVAMPLLIEELGRRGIANGEAIVRLGSIASFGVLAYALGKLLLTRLGDFWGGKRSFTIGLGGAIAFTLLFVSKGALPIFTIAWVGNRLVQSIGWAGLIKVCSRWFGYSSYGTILGIISLSFLVGDAVARRWMGSLIEHGYGWRALFLFAAAVAGVVLLANLLFLRDSRTELEFAEPQVNPLNVYAATENTNLQRGPRSFWSLLRPLLGNRAFLIVCVLSFGCTIVRETFNTWTPVFLHDAVGYNASRAASLSAIFPGVGAISVVLTGWLSDRLGIYGRSAVMFFGSAATAVALLCLALPITGGSASSSTVILIGVVAFGLLGPYSYLAGAFALDFGGDQGAASSSGIIDGIGYLGGVLAGDTVARLSVASGWRSVFLALAVVCAFSAVASACLFLLQRMRVRETSLVVQPLLHDANDVRAES